MKKIKPIAPILNKWYKKNSRQLPWRETRDPYKIWISEVMLQQTTVNACTPYYKKWIDVFPTVHDLAEASLKKVLRLWQGLGYYQRARNLHAAAQVVVKQFQGKVPADAETLRKLPGFGPYTTNAVLSIAYGQKLPIIDANVRRVFMRLLAMEGDATPRQDKTILPYVEESLPCRNIHIFNQALMELGALVCRNRQPLCLQCPLKNLCRAYEKGIQEVIPTVKSKTYRHLNVAIGVIQEKNKYYIQQRAEKGLLAGLWEFPGGKIEKNENPKEALKREILEECGVKVLSAKHLMDAVHFYTNNKVKLHVYSCVVAEFPPEDKTHHWVSLREIEAYPFPSGSVKIIEKLRQK